MAEPLSEEDVAGTVFDLGKQYDPEQHKNDVRSILAYALVALLFVTIGAVLFFIGYGRDDDVLTQSVMPAVIALVGTALGFYFGQEARDNNGTGGTGR